MFRANMLPEVCPQLLPLRLCIHHRRNHKEHKEHFFLHFFFRNEKFFRIISYFVEESKKINNQS